MPDKEKFEDDGRTIASMDFEEIGGRQRGKVAKQKVDYKARSREISDLKMTKKERLAIVKAVYLQLIPFVVIMFGTMALVILLLMFLWGKF